MWVHNPVRTFPMDIDDDSDDDFIDFQFYLTIVYYALLDLSVGLFHDVFIRQFTVIYQQWFLHPIFAYM